MLTLIKGCIGDHIGLVSFKKVLWLRIFLISFEIEQKRYSMSWLLATQNGKKLSSRRVYCAPLYGILILYSVHTWNSLTGTAILCTLLVKCVKRRSKNSCNAFLSWELLICARAYFRTTVWQKTIAIHVLVSTTISTNHKTALKFRLVN